MTPIKAGVEVVTEPAGKGYMTMINGCALDGVSFTCNEGEQEAMHEKVCALARTTCKNRGIDMGESAFMSWCGSNQI